jgi:hypothetical protein
MMLHIPVPDLIYFELIIKHSMRLLLLGYIYAEVKQVELNISCGRKSQS